MESLDTIRLLRECDAGTKMALSSLDEVLDHVYDGDLKQLLQESKKHHEKLENEIHNLLSKNETQGGEPNPIAKGMSWVKTNIKLGLDNSDATVADLITDGCGMGIKSLNRYLNQYKAANKDAVDICESLTAIEEELVKKLRKYL